MPSLLGTYDPAEMRRQAIFRGMMGAGASLLGQQPSRVPIGFGQSLGAGLQGFGQGMDQGKQEYYSMLEQQREQLKMEQKEKNRKAFEKILPSLPADIQNAYQANPDVADMWAEETVKNSLGGSQEYGVTGIYTEDPDTGELGLGQLSKSGGFRPVDLKGRKLAPGTERIDLGTEWGVMDRAGNLISRYPKDIAGAKRQEEIGKGQGEAETDYASIQSKMPGLERVVSELDKLSEKATYTSTGRLWDEIRREVGAEPREAAVARTRYISMVDNQVLPLLRDTFGAQFTEREGAALRATMGDPNKTPQEKQAVLKSFIEQKRRDVEALAIRSQNPATPAPGDSDIDALVNQYRSR